MIKRALPGLLLIGALAGCGGGSAPDIEDPATFDVAEPLMEADRAFARAVRERGIEGWMSFFAPDAAKVVPGGDVTRGLANIRRADASVFEDAEVLLQWEPTAAGFFEDEDHGFTTGTYTLSRLVDGEPVETLGSGTYLTIWRRDADGWRVILDTGVPDAGDEG